MLTGFRVSVLVWLMAYDPPLKEAFRRVGGPKKMAQAIGVGASAVAQWRRVPAIHIFRIEALTGIPAEKLRPDMVPTRAMRRYQLVQKSQPVQRLSA
jgi:DNA-binding transcriptional regulator YdaS (Cro superfamily)